MLLSSACLAGLCKHTLQFARQSSVARTIDQEGGYAQQVPCQADMPVVHLQAKIDDIGQRILLSIDPAVCHGASQIRDINECRNETKPTESSLVLRIVEGAQTQPGTIRRRANRPHGVADMTNAVIPPCQHRVWRCVRYAAREGRAGFTVQAAEHRVP